jgi:hypothetical protein
MHENRGRGKTIGSKRLSHLGKQTFGAGGNLAKHHKARLSGQLQQVGGKTHGGGIKETGAARDKRQVTHPDSIKGGVLAARRGVDHREFAPGFFGGFKGRGKPRRLHGFHGWPFGLPQITPCCCACLWVEVDYHGGLSGSLSGNGKVNSQRGFAGAAFLAHNHNGFHGGFPAILLSNYQDDKLC